MLNPKDLSEVKTKLLKQKDDLQKQLQKFANKDRTIKDNYVTKFPNIGRDDEDNAEEFSQYDRSLPLEQQLELELKKTNEAIDKINNDKYGICTNCNQEINVERLKVYPQAENCLNCSKKE
jgi:RNA polymerase-binding protein DksA